MSMTCVLYAISADAARQAIANPEMIENLLDDGNIDQVSLEKSWHGIHFTLTGTAWEGDPPLNFILGGGQEVGEDIGYGAARIIKPEDVVEINGQLGDFSDDHFAQRFDLNLLEENEIYPQIWDEPLEDLLEEYTDYFRATRELIVRAAGKGQALLVAMM
ncbi:MAG: YfbM family protein [Zavarzinella sp.]